MMLIGSVGYGLAAIGFALFAFLLLVKWRGRIEGVLLVVATILSAAWASAAALEIDTIAHWQLVGVLEVLRNTAWLAFLGRITPAGQGLVGLPRHLLSLAPAAFVLIYGLVGIAVGSPLDAISRVVGILIVTGLVTAITGLVLIEHFYRALQGEARKSMLPLILGLGGIFAYDLFLYSHGLLFRGIHTELWSARGFANLLVVPLLLLAARRNQSWSVDVFISRHVVFYTTSIIGIGTYLVVMAVVGYVLRSAGGEWGPVVQAIFLFGAGILLAWMVFSAVARARLKVFIAKHFFRSKYDYRVEWLNLTRRLSADALDEPLPERCLAAMTRLAIAEGGALWATNQLDEKDGYHLIAKTGVLAKEDAPKIPGKLLLTDTLIEFMVQRRWTVNLSEALRNPETHPGLIVPEWLEQLGPRALIVPLLNHDRLRGIALLYAHKSVGRLSYEDIDLFRVAGMQVAAVLAQAEADQLLAESRQFEAYNRFAAFIMHDLKNVIAQQSLVVRNAAKYRDDPEFIDDALDTVANSVERMQRLLEQLKRGQGVRQVERVDVARLISDTVRYHTDREPLPTANYAHHGIRLRIDRERLAAVLGHLLTNAQDATPATGRVTVEAALDEGSLVLAVEDDGAGMEEAFIRERLFRPFDSTKGSKGMGIGAYQARKFVESVGGEVRLRSAPGEGTRFEMRFPAELVEQVEESDQPEQANPPEQTAQNMARKEQADSNFATGAHENKPTGASRPPGTTTGEKSG